MILAFFRFIFCMIIYLFPCILEGKIIVADTINDCIPHIEPDTWVLVGLDNTTFESKQALGHIEWFDENARKKMENGMTLEEAIKEIYPEWIRIQERCPVKYVEKEFIPALKDLQKQAIVVLGLTHRQPSLAKATFNQLHSLDLDFSLTDPIQKELIVESETATKYKNGILFTGEYNKKGEILVKFLSMTKHIPKKIVFIDDKKNHVEEVELALLGMGIFYVGIHYTAFENLEKIYVSEIAEFQYKFFNENLSNEDVLLLMKKEGF